MSEFQEKVVLVTGAGRGLGRAVAMAFAAQGAIVAANDINPISLDELVAQCTATGGRAHAYCFDIAKRMPVIALVSQVVEEWGRIDIVINNAAVGPQAALLDMDEWDWQRTLDVNLSGAFFVLQQVAQIMRQHGGGVVVSIGPKCATRQTQRSAYLVSKAGLLSLTKQAASELAADNIRIHMVCPGPIDAGIVNSLQEQLEDSEAEPSIIPTVDIELVLWLCRRSAANLNSIVINCSLE